MTDASPTPEHDRSGSLRSLAEATIDVIETLEPAEFLAAITPERLGHAMGYAPSSVRYQLTQAQRRASADGASQARRWAFDRVILLEAVVDALLARLRAAEDVAAAAYATALRDAAKSGDMTALGAAMVRQLTVGDGGEPVERRRASGRPYLLALAACDHTGTVAEAMRGEQAQRVAAMTPTYELTLRLTRRVLRQGLTLTDVMTQVHLYLDGLSIHSRFEPELDPVHAVRSTVAIFCTATEPASGVESPGVVDELVRRLLPDAG